jgi:hypothetical protein
MLNDDAEQVPAVTHDFLPTIMEALHVQHDHPSWALDGLSLMPFITAAAEAIPTRRPQPIGFWWGDSQVWMDNDMKLTNAQGAGQGCPTDPPWLHPSNNTGGFRLFNLSADHTESVDLTATHPSTFAAMHRDLEAWEASVSRSMQLEVRRYPSATCNCNRSLVQLTGVSLCDTVWSVLVTRFERSTNCVPVALWRVAAAPCPPPWASRAATDQL